MTLDLASPGCPPATSEQASAAEMKFAGHYLNIFGMLLLVVGVVSNLKSAGATNGMLETALGVALGVVLLAAGEYTRDRGRYSHPLLTGGFCLLFLAVCSAHFRYGLMGQQALFGWLLLVVIGSNASVFRHDSKLLGNVMLTVYFLTPIFMTFSFTRFSTIFLYLLAINLGATIVAFYKRWEFQLTVSALGSYAFYFAHFRTEAAWQSLLFLLAVYGLSLVVNYSLYFLKPESGDSNMLLSLVSQVIFIVLSAVVVMGLPNWSRVLLYVVLALGQAAVAYLADQRRKQHENFAVLSSGSSIMSLLFACVSISFVTYFSETTSYFGLVTFLWFAFALSTLEFGLRVERHRRVMSRFSYFGLLLGSVQLLYVLPAMEGSQWLQLGGLGLYWLYVVSLYRRKELLTERVLTGSAVAGTFLVVNSGVHLLSPLAATAAFIALAVFFFLVNVNFDLKWLVLVPHLLGAAALWMSLMIFPTSYGAMAMLALSVVVFAAALEIALRRGGRYGYAWVWVGLLALRAAAIPFHESVSLGLVGLALAHLLGKAAALRVSDGRSLSLVVELGSAAAAVVVFMTGTTPIPVLFSVVLILSLSHYLQFRADRYSSEGDLLVWLALVVRLLAESYHPYPVACLTFLAACSLVAAYSGQSKAGAALQGLTALGVMVLPLTEGPVVELLLVVSLMVAVFHRVRGSEEMQASGFALLLVICKWTVMVDQGPLSTLLWALIAFALLYYSVSHEELGAWNECNGGLFDLSRWMYFLVFVKSVLYDTNFVEQLAPIQYPCTFLVSAVFLLTGHTLVEKREARNFFLALGLMVCSFQVTFILHAWWGDNLLFQPVLSGFWAVVALLVVAAGISLNLKVYRLFGLVMLVANTAKILLVDIHVLDSYSKTNTYLILGLLLMATSFLYQRKREELCPSTPA